MARSPLVHGQGHLREVASIVGDLVNDQTRRPRLDRSGDLYVDSGHHMIMGPYSAANIGAGASTSLRLDIGNSFSSFILCNTPGSILSVVFMLDAPVTAGANNTLTVTLNQFRPTGGYTAATETAVQTWTFTSADPAYVKINYPKDQFRFDEDDMFIFRISTPGGWTSTGTDIAAWLRVEM